MRRRIAVFTSTRADAYPLAPVIETLGTSEDVDLTVVVAGEHVLPANEGRTMPQPPLGIPVVRLDVPFGRSDSVERLAEALGKVTVEMAAFLGEHRPDVLLVLGDRWELLGVVGAALLFQIPIAHLHGGEITEGALDDRVRHAVTKLADLHLCATEDAAARVRSLGEEPWRIHVTGAPSLDRLREVEPLGLDGASRLVGAPLTRPLGLVTYHPPTVDRVSVGERATAVFRAAGRRLSSVIVTHPGPDPGSTEVLAAISRVAADFPNVHVVESLGPSYPAVLATIDVLVGNSSSGIVEAATFRLPVVNVGDRQAGRPQAANVIQCDESEAAVMDAIDRALSQEFRRELGDVTNPYGDGRAAARILRVLLDAPLERLASKRWLDSGSIG